MQRMLHRTQPFSMVAPKNSAPLACVFGGRLQIPPPSEKTDTQMPDVLKDSSSRVRALARQKDTEISRNAFLGISFCTEECHIHLVGVFPFKMLSPHGCCAFLAFFKDAKRIKFGIFHFNDPHILQRPVSAAPERSSQKAFVLLFPPQFK